jgi:lipoyl(octanoyl) transferase
MQRGAARAVRLRGAAARWLSTLPPYATVDCDYYSPGTVPYVRAWRWQQELLRRRIEQPPAEALDAAGASAARPPPLRDVVIFLQHPPVYTLGRAATRAHLLFDPAAGAVDAEVHAVERGGQVTFHGPGQLVVYPVLNLARFRKDLHWYVRTVEEVVITSLRRFGLDAGRAEGYPGVWVQGRKIAQVGMNCSKWVTSHGLAINVDPDMRYFGHIVPCGIDDRPVTSMAAELRRPVRVDEVAPVVAEQFAALFNARLLPARGDPVSDAELSRAVDEAQQRQLLGTAPR